MFISHMRNQQISLLMYEKIKVALCTVCSKMEMLDADQHHINPTTRSQQKQQCFFSAGLTRKIEIYCRYEAFPHSLCHLVCFRTV